MPGSVEGQQLEQRRKVAHLLARGRRGAADAGDPRALSRAWAQMTKPRVRAAGFCLREDAGDSAFASPVGLGKAAEGSYPAVRSRAVRETSGSGV
jgi:hypothetical protein